MDGLRTGSHLRRRGQEKTGQYNAGFRHRRLHEPHAGNTVLESCFHQAPYIRYLSLSRRVRRPEPRWTLAGQCRRSPPIARTVGALAKGCRCGQWRHRQPDISSGGNAPSAAAVWVASTARFGAPCCRSACTMRLLLYPRLCPAGISSCQSLTGQGCCLGSPG
jgi:hypothetical protein